jgi:hypothetical protein
VDVNHVDEIDEIFDAISYRKGASVIRMLQSYLGAEIFQVCFSYFPLILFYQVYQVMGSRTYDYFWSSTYRLHYIIFCQKDTTLIFLT